MDDPIDCINPDAMFDYDDASSGSGFPQGLFANHEQELGLHPYLSRPPSLSPSSQTASLFPPSLSPPSSASPRSVHSLSSQDDMLLGNSFSSSELDMLLFQTNVDAGNKQGHPFFLGEQNAFNATPNFASQDVDTLRLLDVVNTLGGNYGPTQPASLAPSTPFGLPTSSELSIQSTLPRYSAPLKCSCRARTAKDQPCSGSFHDQWQSQGSTCAAQSRSNHLVVLCLPC